MYDLLVLGGGPGGSAAALRAARGGQSVVLFEPRAVGGTCLNRGCIPTKALLHGARSGCAWPDLAAQAQQAVSALRTGLEGQLQAAGVVLVRSAAVVTGPHTAVSAEGGVYEGKHILVATGSVPGLPAIPGVDQPGVLTSDMLLSEVRPYARLVVLGGGVAGVELACIWASAGCRVTLLEKEERLLPALDRELAQSLTIQMRKDGVEVLTGVEVTRIDPGPCVVLTHNAHELVRPADAVLVAAGRRPATSRLFDGVAPAMEHGFLTVDAQFCTSIPSIYAIGDAIGGAMLAHKAESEGRAVADLLLGRCPARGTSPIPACVYTNPELAQVGLTADEAASCGIPFVVGRCTMSGNGRTLIEGGKRGFLKLLFHRESRVLLGAQVCCYHASELISELTLAVTLQLTAQALLRSVRPHPTCSEAISEAVEAGLEAFDAL